MAVAASACGLNGHPGVPRAEPVLGQQKGRLLVVGQPAPGGTGQLNAVSCPTAKRCWAVGVAGPNPPAGGATVIVATANGGLSWRPQHVAGGSTPELSGIACPTPTDCMAVGSNGASIPGSGVVVTTVDAGTAWAPAAAPTNALTVTTVACASPSDCTAIVSDGTATWSAHSSDFGQSWQQEGTFNAAFIAGNDLTCTAGGTCLVAGYTPTSNGHGQGAVSVSADSGKTWSLATVPTGLGVLQSVTCQSAAVCLAAGTTSTTVSDIVPAKGELLHSTDGGHTWTPSTSPPPVDDIYAVTCPSVRVCAMVGTKWVGLPAIGTGALAQSQNAGTTFRASPGAYVPISLTALSCPDAARCIAVGGNTLARLTLLAPKVRPAPARTHGSVRS
jgi:hypothetical protein